MNFLTGHQAAALRTLRETWSEDEIVIIGAAALRYHLGHEWRETDDLDLSIATSVEAHVAVLFGARGFSKLSLGIPRSRPAFIDVGMATRHSKLRDHLIT